MRSTYRDLMDIVSWRVLRALRDVGCAGRGPKPGWQIAVLLFFLAQAFVTLNARCLASPHRLSLSFAWAAQDEALQQGLSALKDNHLDVALERLTAAERESPFNANIRNFRGIVFAQMGRNSEAASEYQEAIRLDPRLEDAHKNLGFLEWTEHNLEAARTHLYQALDIAPEDAFAHYYLGRVQLDAKLYESAFKELDRSQVPWPADVDFLVQAATGYLALGRLDEARTTLDRLRTMPLRDAQAVGLASLLLSVHENDAAIDLLGKLRKRLNGANAGWAHFDLALAYLLSGYYAKAADVAHGLLKAKPAKGAMTPEAGSAWSLIGIASARLHQREAAVDAFRQACKLNASREEHWLNLTRELMDLNRYTEAISAVQEGLASNPSSYALHLRLGAAYLASDRYSDAESVFRQLVAAGDPLPTSYVGLAQVLLRTGRADEAVSELTTAGQKLGTSFLISYFRGLALNRAGRAGEAVSAFEEATQLDPNSSEAHLELGKTELATHRAHDAVTELQESLRLDPGNVPAQRLLSQAYRRAGDERATSQEVQASAAKKPSPEAELLGDFLPPEWEFPRD
jgi:tetratricopeptide (TPR) repeat protein